MNEESQVAKFEGWAVVELMGHRREIGYVTTENFGPACLFRVDTPALPEREYELQEREWVRANGDQKIAPAGSKVQRAAVPARSVLVGPPAIYAINPCTEEFARRAIEEMIRRPLVLLALPQETPLLESRAAPAPEEQPEDRICEECGQTPEEGHADGCSFDAGPEEE